MKQKCFNSLYLAMHFYIYTSQLEKKNETIKKDDKTILFSI